MNPVKKILYDNSKDREAYEDYKYNAFSPEQTDDWWKRATPKQRAQALRKSSNPIASRNKDILFIDNPHLPVMTSLRLGTYLGQRRK